MDVIGYCDTIDEMQSRDILGHHEIERADAAGNFANEMEESAGSVCKDRDERVGCERERDLMFLHPASVREDSFGHPRMSPPTASSLTTHFVSVKWRAFGSEREIPPSPPTTSILSTLSLAMEKCVKWEQPFVSTSVRAGEETSK